MYCGMSWHRCLLLSVLLLTSGCATLTAEVSEDIAPRVSTDVAIQVGTAVVEQVGTLVAADRSILVAQPSAAPRQSQADEAPQPQPPSYDCLNKTCGQMSSCEEAVYKLNVCGHSQRDANNDGVPCESLCRRADVPAIAARFAGISPTAVPTSPPGADEIGLVTRVVDGDTIDVLLDGVNTRVRYLQMNTPERNEPCSSEATQANADLVAGQMVRLVPDVELIDPYDRLLRYIFVGDVLVNRVLVEQGFAEVVLYPPNDRHYDEFVRLENEAAAAGRGCHPTGVFNDGSTRR